MRLARLSFAALALVTLAACTQDAVGPNDPNVDGSSLKSPSAPLKSGLTFGSGGKATSDSAVVSVSSVQTTATIGGQP